ncbi:hypothetical protein EPUS_01533 [Endocarpon pusillum Z07020]|uniref:Uncharacterized protein n=1 Tax=Endocarpon pusillum (strain Z07020 / HMAS-L-300199) TaxID=1263415 RepID=U1GTH8_ENDPU|nr:uncharacterized protein EPUS_01533 [Endocarpon pusillum Z07020]ERF75703.1 hypothetical protein EPUS_01533 [Endocarpon pusillum Z07020]
MSEGQIPVGRTVCGPAAVIEDDTEALPFPILASDHKWRNISSFGTDQTWGPLKELKIGGLQRIEITTKLTQARAKWVALGSEFGAATAGMAVVSQNRTTAIGRACTLDFRWALGQTFRKGDIVLNAFETLIGKPPQTSGSTFWDFGRASFFHEGLVPWYGDTIKVDQEWLDTMSTWSVLSNDAGGYNMSGFEALLDATVVASPDHTMFLGPESTYDSLVTLEYITSVYFVDAISRTGWDLSLLYANNTIINPILQQGSTENQKILNGGPVFSRPTNIPYSVVNANWHTYGAAWTLQDSGQWISVAILSVHMVIAIVHSLILVVRRRSVETWDSIEELIVLAWNSMPTRRNDELRNCASGILRTKTLESKVRVVAIEEQGLGSRVELVVVDEMARNKDGRSVDTIKPGEAYI